MPHRCGSDAEGVPTSPGQKSVAFGARLLVGIDELKVVLGPDVTPHVERVKELLLRALAARERGDRPQSLQAIAGAMAALSELGDQLVPRRGR